MQLPTKALGIPYVGNKWAHMRMFAAALPRRYDAYLDLTFGCGICSVFMYELGVRKFIANDASPYPRLIATALLGDDAWPMSSEEILNRVHGGYRKGWLFDNVSRKAFQHRTACTIDAMCESNQDSPLMLVAIAAVLSNGAMADFRYGTTKHWSADAFRIQVIKKIGRLNARVGRDCRTKITAIDYLNLSKRLDRLKNYVCYLDPAWPAQPLSEGKKPVSGNDRVYGFYAAKLMSVLMQRNMPMPAEYDVTAEECYVGMRKTIEALMENNTVLIAYQSRPDVVDVVKNELLYGLNYSEWAEQRKSGTKLWEYLWRIIH